MDEILLFLQQDFLAIILGVFIAMAGIVAMAEIIGKFSIVIGRPVKWIKNKEKDHELLTKTVEGLDTLQKRHEDDIKRTVEHEHEIQETLKAFMIEMRDEVKQFTNNRANDREQSRHIQETWTNTIQKIVDNQKDRDRQIDSLITANKEMLAEEINKKYKYYVSIQGIPEDEVDEFVSLHKAYNGVGGNHHGDAKYEYCMNHLPIIPVETKLVMKRDE